MLYTNIIRPGTLVGTDRMGNRYYESDLSVTERKVLFAFCFCLGLFGAHGGAQRWVEGSHYYFDPSEVEPAWHRWLHYITDTPPPPDGEERRGRSGVWGVEWREGKEGTDALISGQGYQVCGAAQTQHDGWTKGLQAVLLLLSEAFSPSQDQLGGAGCGAAQPGVAAEAKLVEAAVVNLFIIASCEKEGEKRTGILASWVGD